MNKRLYSLLFLLISNVALSANLSTQLQISALSEQLYLVKSFKQIVNIYDAQKAQRIDANSLIYIDNKDAYLIDTPWNEAYMPVLMVWLKNQGLTLKTTVVTHFHEDQTAGLAYLTAHGYKSYASEQTNALLKKDKKSPATNTFSGPEFSLLAGKIEVYYPGAGYTADNLVVWLATEKTLVGGCLLRANEAETIGWIGDANTAQWHHSVKKVQQRYGDSKQVIPGHGDVGQGQSIIDHTLSITKRYHATLPK
jgi:metallo-beta-lactamase class B